MGFKHTDTIDKEVKTVDESALTFGRGIMIIMDR